MKRTRNCIIFSLITLLFSSCTSASPEDIKPTNFIVTHNEVELIVNSERNLNDLFTYKFEPANVSCTDIIYSSDNSENISLNDSVVKALKVGLADIKATSVSNSDLSINLKINVIDPNIKSTYKVNYLTSEDYKVTGIKESYFEDEQVSFIVESIKDNKEIEKVCIDSRELVLCNDGSYKFLMKNKDMNLEIFCKEKKIINKYVVSLGNHEHSKVFIDDVEMIEPLDIDENSIISFTVKVDEEYELVDVKINDTNLTAVNEVYSFEVVSDSVINISTKKKGGTNYGTIGKYSIVYEMTTARSKLLDTEEAVEATFKTLDEGKQVITKVQPVEYIYGGGYGGSGATAWKLNNVLKFGTTSVNGKIQISLSKKVNQVKITGFVSSNTCKVRIGDAASKDWSEETDDNKTTLHTCSEMKVLSKDTADLQFASITTLDFEETDELVIATTNNKPLYISAIEFLLKEPTK